MVSSSELALVVKASEVKARQVEWLWPKRVPLGGLTVLAGTPGLGKSLLTINLIARESRGEFGRPRGSLLLTAEDSLEHTVRPRLDAAAADVSRVHLLRDASLISLPSGAEWLGELVAELRVGLVIIDPLMAFLSCGVDSWRDQSVRHALAPLAHMADANDVAVIAVAHLNKNGRGDPLSRLGGSVGVAAAARSVLLLGRDPDDPTSANRILAHVKTNLGAPARSIRFEVIEGDSQRSVRVVERGESHYSAYQLLEVDQPEAREKLEDAVEFLVAELGTGAKPVRELQDKAIASGIRPATLRRAKEQLKVVSTKVSLDRWEWRLPDSAGSSRSRVGGTSK